MHNVHPRFLLIGSIVTVPIKGTLDLATHFAIVTGQLGQDGLPMVVANSASTKGPALITWTEFTGGQLYKDAYYPSTLHPMTVVQNAFSHFGRKYDLINWNCEHFANECHGLSPVSKQVGAVVAVALLGGLAFLASRAA